MPEMEVRRPLLRFFVLEAFGRTKAAHFLAAASGENPNAFRKHNVPLLPFLAVALEREVLDDVPTKLAVVLISRISIYG
jgi:hypothetical protein